MKGNYIKDLNLKMKICISYINEIQRACNNINNQEYCNVIKDLIESYTKEELNEKFNFYIQKALKSGILSIESFIAKEKNSFIKELLYFLCEGYEPESLKEYGDTRVKNFLSEVNDKIDMIEIGFKLINKGYNPIFIEEILLNLKKC